MIPISQSNSNMSSVAIRTVTHRHTMSLPGSTRKKLLKAQIPEEFLREETAENRQRIQRMWNEKFLPSVIELKKTRRNENINAHIRHTVFNSGMENLCRDFSRQQMHVKVQWKNNKLVLLRLSQVPHSAYSGPGCVAEVPQVLQEAEAELIGVIETSESSPEGQCEVIAVAYDPSSFPTGTAGAPFAMTVTPIATVTPTTVAVPIQAVPVERIVDLDTPCVLGHRIV